MRHPLPRAVVAVSGKLLCHIGPGEVRGLPVLWDYLKKGSGCVGKAIS